MQHYQSASTKSETITKSQVTEFFETQKRFDLYRKQNLFATHPYFVEMAEKFNVETW